MSKNDDIKEWANLLDSAPDDPAVKASILCRLAARLWVEGGGDSATFGRMAQTQAEAEVRAQLGTPPEPPLELTCPACSTVSLMPPAKNARFCGCGTIWVRGAGWIGEAPSGEI